MKTKLPLVIAIASALGAPFVVAQDERPPQPPRPADGEQRPPTPPPGERRERGPGGPEVERGERGERGPGRPGGERTEGRRGEGERGRRDESFGGDRGMMRQEKPTPYLGVMTAPVPPALGAQIGLAEGFGVVVDEVVPDSPAAVAGVLRHDVLKLLDDQQLTGPDQLAALVRSKGKDASVNLTLLRKGQEQKVTVRIGERMLPVRRMGTLPGAGEFAPRLDEWREKAEEAARKFRENLRPEELRERGEDLGRKMQEQMRTFQERVREYQRKIEEWRKNPGDSKPPEPPVFEAPPSPRGPGRPNGAGRAPEPPGPADLFREARPGGAPQVRVDQDGEVTTWNTAQARVVVKDDGGELEVRTENGHRTVTAKDPAGAVIFTGPIDTEEQRQSLPAPIREKLAKIHVQSEVRASVEAGSGRPQPPAEREVQ